MKVVVSACLLSEPCRYDGKSKDNLLPSLKGYEVIAFCPEKFMGVPRPKIALHVKEERLHVIREDGLDVTDALVKSVDDFVATLSDIDCVILKSKSPSCGYKTTPIYGSDTLGNGVLAQAMLKRFPEAKFYDENSFKEHFGG